MQTLLNVVDCTWASVIIAACTFVYELDLRFDMVIRCKDVTAPCVAVCGQVGHTAAVLVARYSPRMFRIDGTLKACLALGSQVCLNSNQHTFSTTPTRINNGTSIVHT